MSKPTDVGNPALIDQLCDQFQAEWHAGRRPVLESFLAKAPAETQAALLAELLSLEVEQRLLATEQPKANDYRGRFSAHAEVVAEVFDQPPPTIQDRAAEPDPGGVKLTLTVTAGPEMGRVFSFTCHDVLMAGRSRQALLQLKDNYFSRYHFLIEANPPLCHLTDMGSRNGTLVNGKKVQSVELRDGDEIKAGHTTLRVSLATSAPAPSPDGSIPEASTNNPPVAAMTAGPHAPKPPRSLHGTIEPATPPAAWQLQGTANAAVRKPAQASSLALPGYRVEAEVGRGGMGVVYRATRLADGVPVALKSIIPGAAASPGQLQRFLREAIILCQLKHPHIVAFHDLLLAEGRPVIAMEFVEGRNVADLLQEHGPLSVRTAVRIMLQVLAALSYAHAKGFVHRDMKPGNVLLVDKDEGKTVKVADFGLARVFQESRLSGLTLHGDIGGTVAFMPPEQITHFRKVKPSADQYSAAATLYNLLTNQFLFDVEGSATAAVAKVLQSQPVPLRDRRPDVPEELAECIHRALAKNPRDRFANVGAFRRALEPFGQDGRE